MSVRSTHNVAGGEAASRAFFGRSAAGMGSGMHHTASRVHYSSRPAVSVSYGSHYPSSSIHYSSSSVSTPVNGRAACIALAIIGIIASIFMMAFGAAAGVYPLAIAGGILCAASITALSLAIAQPKCLCS
jgi:hypothetical protein